MTEPDLFRRIVTSGACLTIDKVTNNELIYELATLAKTSGAKLTFTLKNLSYDNVNKLCTIAPSSLIFVSH